jgi:protein-S-isoprenylcysteine O-methyltransferase Ste14
MVRIGNFLFHFRNGLFPALCLALLLIAEPRYPFGSRMADGWLDLLGLLIALGGQGLRFLTIGYDYIKRGGLNRQIYADRLVTGGVFSHSRNPLYLGNMLIFLGLAVMANSPEVYLIGVPFCLFAYSAIIRAEEDFLGKKFGQEYREYCARVNRLWPRWDGFERSVADMEFSWKRVISKEYNTTFSWLLFALGLRYWEEKKITGQVPPVETNVLMMLAVFFVVCYLTVRTLKKQGRLAPKLK